LLNSSAVSPLCFAKCATILALFGLPTALRMEMVSTVTRQLTRYIMLTIGLMRRSPECREAVGLQLVRIRMI